MLALAAVSDAVAWAIPISSGIIALATLVFTAIVNYRSASASDVERQGTEIDRLRERLEVCEQGRSELKREIERLSERELLLMRKIVRLEGV